MRQFDYILQAVLLRVAAEDGYFLEEEKRFIKKITDYGDLLAFISQKRKINITWDSLDSLGIKDLKDISLRIFAVELTEIIKNFVTPFAIVDALLPKNYAEELSEKIMTICAALCACDADEVGSNDFMQEYKVAFVLVKNHFEKQWNEIVAQCDKISKKSSASTASTAPSKNSLKEIYLKKNR